MNIKVMQVFYGADCLPYKDSERQVHYPITSGSFLGASNTVEIHFYLDEMGNNVSWVVNGKLPNGKIGHTLLTNRQFDSALNEYYYVFILNAFYTQYKGDLYLGLSGYQGNISYTYDSDTDTYTITGTPTIQTTGVIKLNIAYSTGVLDGDIDEDVTLEDIMSSLGQKINSLDGIVILKQQYDSINSYDVSDYEDGQYFYIPYKPLKGFYVKSSGLLTNDYRFIGLVHREASISNGTDLSSQLSEIKKRYCILSYSNFNNIYIKSNEILGEATFVSVRYVAKHLDNEVAIGNSYFNVDLTTGIVSNFHSETLYVPLTDYLESQLLLKADLSYVNTELAKKVNLAGSNTISANNTFTGSNVFDNSPQTNENITDESADTKLTTKKYVKDLMDSHLGDYAVLNDKVSDIESKIPSQASSSNKLADKDWVNSTINSLAAFYITKNAQGDPFATYAELASATTFYSGGVVRVPTRNDYCLVVSDENHDNASCRYIYQGTQWEFQFVVNETPFTSDQIKAINSGITDILVAQITTNANAIATINGKLPITKDFVIPTTAWSLVDGKYVAVLDSGNDFIINDNAVHIYTPTSDADQLIRDLYGINVSSNGTTQKFTFICNLSDTAPTEVINFTIAQFGGN